MAGERAAIFFRTAISATLGAAAFLVGSANAAAQVVYSSPQFDGGFVPGATSVGVPIIVGDSLPNGAFLPPNGAVFAGSPDFSGAIPTGTPLGGQIIGEVPFNGDINSIPLLEQKQPNAPRPLPALNVPRTDADFEKRVEALAFFETAPFDRRFDAGAFASLFADRRRRRDLSCAEPRSFGGKYAN